MISNQAKSNVFAHLSSMLTFFWLFLYLAKRISGTKMIRKCQCLSANVAFKAQLCSITDAGTLWWKNSCGSPLKQEGLIFNFYICHPLCYPAFCCCAFITRRGIGSFLILIKSPQPSPSIANNTADIYI